MDAHNHDNPLLNQDKPERKQTSCTDPPSFFLTTFTSFHSLSFLMLFLLQQSKNLHQQRISLINKTGLFPQQ